MSDLIRVVGDAYNFAVRPPIQQGLLAGVMQQLVFQSGTFEKNNEKLPILQLVILNNGEIVTTALDALSLRGDTIARHRVRQTWHPRERTLARTH